MPAIEFSHWAPLIDHGELLTEHRLRVRAEWEDSDPGTGRLSGWYVTEGTLYKRGMPLLTMDTRSLEAAYGIRQVELMELKARSLNLDKVEDCPLT